MVLGSATRCSLPDIKTQFSQLGSRNKLSCRFNFSLTLKLRWSGPRRGIGGVQPIRVKGRQGFSRCCCSSIAEKRGARICLPEASRKGGDEAAERGCTLLPLAEAMALAHRPSKPVMFYDPMATAGFLDQYAGRR